VGVDAPSRAAEGHRGDLREDASDRERARPEVERRIMGSSRPVNTPALTVHVERNGLRGAGKRVRIKIATRLGVRKARAAGTAACH